MNRASVYQERAAYCAYLLRRVADPRRQALIERERRDWVMLADQAGVRSDIDGASAAPPQHRSFAPAARRLEAQGN